VALAHANIAQLQSVAPACRTSVEYELLYAANAALLHRWDEAFAHYNAALQIDRRPEIYFNRGLTRLQLGDIAGATQDLVIAVRFRPVLNDQLSGELHDRVAAQAGIK
jgi:tetratricopeptide (TPR) repeat protein